MLLIRAVGLRTLLSIRVRAQNSWCYVVTPLIYRVRGTLPLGGTAPSAASHHSPQDDTTLLPPRGVRLER